MDGNQFSNLYLGNFQPSEESAFLWELAKEYHERTESYDRTVCTGPIINDAIVPMNNFERSKTLMNAHKIRKEIYQRALDRGIEKNKVKKAIVNYLSTNPRINADLQTP